MKTDQNGTGVYEELSILVSRQRDYLIGSTEKGMQLVKDNKNYAVIGGRETFYYDIKRFGNNNTISSTFAISLSDRYFFSRGPRILPDTSY